MLADHGLLLEIRSILLSCWDPVGIRQEPQAQDEYDAYLGRIAETCRSLSVESVTAMLLSIERGDMELPGDAKRANGAARHLLSLFE